MKKKDLKDLIDCIDSLGVMDKSWLRMYCYACMYYENNNDLLIPTNYTIEKNGEIIKLGKWIVDQRVIYSKRRMKQEKIQLLEKIGMTWKVNRDKWDKVFRHAKKYYEENGNLQLSYNYSVMDGRESIELGKWIAYQRVIYKKGEISQKRIDLLNSIGMVWEIKNDTWDEIYEYAKEYYESKGNLLVPHNYSIKKDDNTISLGGWISNQRTSYKKGKLSQNRIDQLNSIGMVWDARPKKEKKEIELGDYWTKMYQLLLEYYNKNHNIVIPRNYTYVDDTGEEIRLGNWLNLQRKLKRMNSTDSNKRKIELLDDIGMVWEYVNSDGTIEQPKQLVKVFNEK